VPAKVGVVAEANTSFGIEFRSLFVGCASRRYTFPLHISRLRADASAAPELPVLLTSPATALKLGEHIHPVDLVPPMRPDVASPVTDQSIGAMLDDIRHSGLAAVGIYATDVRDALFLSREIKRAVRAGRSGRGRIPGAAGRPESLPGPRPPSTQYSSRRSRARWPA
jgi:hypothetical protein